MSHSTATERNSGGSVCQRRGDVGAGARGGVLVHLRRGLGDVVERHLRSAPADDVVALVERDAVEPGRELRCRRGSRWSGPGSDERLLQHVLGVVGVAAHAQRDRVDAIAVPDDDLVEGAAIAGAARLTRRWSRGWPITSGRRLLAPARYATATYRSPYGCARCRPRARLRPAARAHRAGVPRRGGTASRLLVYRRATANARASRLRRPARTARPGRSRRRQHDARRSGSPARAPADRRRGRAAAARGARGRRAGRRWPVRRAACGRAMPCRSETGCGRRSRTTRQRALARPPLAAGAELLDGARALVGELPLPPYVRERAGRSRAATRRCTPTGRARPRRRPPGCTSRPRSGASCASAARSSRVELRIGLDTFRPVSERRARASPHPQRGLRRRARRAPPPRRGARERPARRLRRHDGAARRRDGRRSARHRIRGARASSSRRATASARSARCSPTSTCRARRCSRWSWRSPASRRRAACTREAIARALPLLLARRCDADPVIGDFEIDATRRARARGDVRDGARRDQHAGLHAGRHQGHDQGASTRSSSRDLGAQIVLGNTYHLHLRPGEDAVARPRRPAPLLGWDGPILTDSGGFQVFSLRDTLLESTTTA